MINKYESHVLVLPEDDANRQIANGFLLHSEINLRKIQVLRSQGGWKNVVKAFNDSVLDMRRYSERRAVLLIDFDGHPERLASIRDDIPSEFHDRVFVLGVLTEPEALRSSLHHQGFEEIGKTLSNDCANHDSTLWDHELLRHNREEIIRLSRAVKPFLFRS